MENGRTMLHAWEKRQMHSEFGWGNLKAGQTCWNGAKDNIKIVSKEQNGKVWSASVRLELQANGGLLIARLHGLARSEGRTLGC